MYSVVSVDCCALIELLLLQVAFCRWRHRKVRSGIRPHLKHGMDVHANSKRRVAAITRHLQPHADSSPQSIQDAGALHLQSIAVQPTAASDRGVPESSYAKIHGAVSQEPATWTQVPALQKNSLQEVIYEKALEEGIAKVHCPVSQSPAGIVCQSH